MGSFLVFLLPLRMLIPVSGNVCFAALQSTPMLANKSVFSQKKTYTVNPLFVKCYL